MTGGQPAIGHADETATDLRRSIQDLMGALDEGTDRLPADLVAEAEETLSRAAARLSMTGAHTVVALCGATGSGKSSLFNRLVADDVVGVSPRRPTTDEVTAAVWGADSGGDVLDWMQVTQRHRVDPPRRAKADALNFDGMILLDLPDVDSIDPSHRQRAQEALTGADVFVWVTDPQKYADAILHDDYLSRLKGHGHVTLVVLNHADRMRSDQAKACRDDLAALLREDGIEDAPVVLTSTRTGAGLEDLAELLASAARSATSARLRLLADVRRHLEDLRSHVADQRADLPVEIAPSVVREILDDAGVDQSLRASELSYVEHGLAATAWPPTTWITGGRRRGGLNVSRASGVSKAQRERIDALARRAVQPRGELEGPTTSPAFSGPLATMRAGGLPGRWGEVLDHLVSGHNRDLSEELHGAIRSADREAPRPAWWQTTRRGQMALFAVSAALLLWFLWCWLGDRLGFLMWPVPSLGPVPIPPIVGLVGLAAGYLWARSSAKRVHEDARHHRERADKIVQDSVSEALDKHLLTPAAQLVARHDRARAYLDDGLAHSVGSHRAGAFPRRDHRRDYAGPPSAPIPSYAHSGPTHDDVADRRGVEMTSAASRAGR